MENYSERRVDEISTNVVRRDLLDYVTVSGAGEPGMPQHSAFAWYPLDAPLPGLSVGTLTPLGCALFDKLGRHLERSVSLVHEPPPFPSLDEEMAERGLISRTMVDMDLMANGMVSRGMAHVDAKIILEFLIDCIMRSLLVFQKEKRLMVSLPTLSKPTGTCSENMQTILPIDSCYHALWPLWRRGW